MARGLSAYGDGCAEDVSAAAANAKSDEGTHPDGNSSYGSLCTSNFPFLFE